MAKDGRFSRSCVAIITPLMLLLGGAGELRAQALSCTGAPFPVLTSLGLVTSNPLSCTVNCSAGGKIALAVAMQPRTTSTLTITVNGTCVEAVDHVPSRVKLQAGSAGTTLQAPSASTDPVLGISGTGVTLTGLTISGGVNALRGRSGSAFTGNNLVIEGASNANVLLDHADLTLNTSTVENSAGDGIDAQYGSTLFLNGGTVQNNAVTGVNAVYDGSAQVFGGAVLQNNGVQGVGGGYGGTAHITAGTVTNNGFGSGGSAGMNSGTGGHLVVEGSSTSVSGNNHNGILVDDGGTALVQNGATIANNLGNGIVLIQGAFAKVRLGAIVQGNAGNGIYAETGTVTVGDTAGAGITIQNNKGNGVLVRTNSLANFDNAGNQITGNSGWGVLCIGTSSNPLIYLPLGTPGTVSPNGAGPVSTACNVAP